jgi:AcrR family transcriptional regulator
MMKTVAEHAIDRRVARTRAALQHALNSLILKKRYEEITITDICNVANVGRSTFYAHYASKDDLKRSGFEPLRRLLAARQKHDKGLGFSLAMFEHARDHRDHYRALVGGRGGTVSLGAIRQILSKLVRDGLDSAVDKKAADAIPRELVVQYVVGAYMAVLTWWLDGGAKLPPQRIEAMFRRLATTGISMSPPP